MFSASIPLYLGVRQIARPTSDISDGNWLNELGNNTNLFASLDEVTPLDDDYIISPLNPSSEPVTIGMDSALQTPLAGQQYAMYRIGKDNPSARIDITVELLQGASVVQTWTYTDVAYGFTNISELITGTITDYSQLRLRFTANKV